MCRRSSSPQPACLSGRRAMLAQQAVPWMWPALPATQQQSSASRRNPLPNLLHGRRGTLRLMKRPAAVLALTIAIAALPRAQSEKLDLATIGRIKNEGLNRSQVMDHISWLSDVYGPRLTGGPGIMQASEWVIKKFTEWGLSNPHRESWPFGKGWSLVRFSAHMIEPQVQPIIGVPASWTPGTNGLVTAEVVRVQIDSDLDFEKYRGTLAGKIVL